MKETIGIFAHVDAGKTTLSEMLLFKAGALRQAGRVDNGNTCMDYDGVEKQRGITIYSALASFCWKNTEFYLIDTPGHKDFFDEMENALYVLDKAILMVSAVEGIQSYTETIWKYLEKQKIPTLIFINKTDRVGADVKRVQEELNSLSKDCVVLTEEALAERDDEFLEIYLSEENNIEQYKEYATRALKNRKIFPIVKGTALKDQGVDELLDLLVFLESTKYDKSKKFGGIIWQIRYDKKGARWTLLKITSGTLFPKMDFSKMISGQSSIKMYKAGEIRSLQGGKSDNVRMAEAGDICAVSGIKDLVQGDTVGIEPEIKKEKTETVLTSGVIVTPGENENDIYEALKILGEETPSLNVGRIGKQIVIHANGMVQLEVLPEIIKRRFDLEVDFERPKVIYKETIAAPVTGYGHYEPLKHYSEVHLRLEPSPTGTGITFESQCSTDYFGQRWQNLVRTHVFERKHKGVLTGSELVDVKVILMAGKEHYLHTSGGDFREATYRAIRQGLMKSKSVLLEPVYETRFIMSTEVSGTVMNHIMNMGGKVECQETLGDLTSIVAVVPVAEMLDYVTVFSSFTHGKGIVSILKTLWEPCHDAERVIIEKGYIAENDLEQPADSVFCKRGVARLIKYNQVEGMLHIPLDYMNSQGRYKNIPEH